MRDTKAVVATALLVTTGCLAIVGCGGRGLEVGESAARDLFGDGVHAIHVPDSAVNDMSSTAHVSTDAIRSVTKTSATTRVWTTVSAALDSLDRSTEGTAREVVVETACSSVLTGNYDGGTIAGNLASNAAKENLPNPTQYLLLTDEVTTDMQEAATSPDANERAAVSVMCFADSKAIG